MLYFNNCFKKHSCASNAKKLKLRFDQLQRRSIIDQVAQNMYTPAAAVEGNRD